MFFWLFFLFAFRRLLLCSRTHLWKFVYLRPGLVSFSVLSSRLSIISYVSLILLPPKERPNFSPSFCFGRYLFFEYSKLLKKVFKMWRGSDCLCSCPITNRMNISNQKTYNMCKQLYSAILTKIILLILCVLSMGFLMRHDETFMVALEISQNGRMDGRHHLQRCLVF